MFSSVTRFPLPFQVSTHGYSQNQILVWKYPSLTQVAKLTGHSYRVLYLVSHVSGNFCGCLSAYTCVKLRPRTAVPVALYAACSLGGDLNAALQAMKKRSVSGFLACKGCFDLLLWKCEALLMNSKACQNSSEEAQASLLVPLRLVRFFTGGCQQGKNLMLSVLLICR